MMRVHGYAVATALAAISFGIWSLDAGTVVGSRHDLSTNFNPESTEPCAYCHTPHHANTSVAAPLWNRVIDTGKIFALYQSPTLNSVPTQPAGSISEACLGCHDGTVSHAVVYMGMTISDKHEVINAPGSGNMPDRITYPNCERCHPEIYGTGEPVLSLGLDLSNDHPISMIYPTPAQDPGLNIPPSLTDGWPSVPLFSGRVECASCHDVHDPDLEPFLNISNAASQLCLTCHQK